MLHWQNFNDMLKAYKVAHVWIYLSGWLQEAYFLKTTSNNNLCILRTKCSPSDTGWRPPQCIDFVPKKMMVWQKELIVHAQQGMKFMHVYFLIIYCGYALMQCQFMTNNAAVFIETTLQIQIYDYYINLKKLQEKQLWRKYQ